MKPIYVILFILMAFSSCKKPCTDPANPECENYNPCFGTEATSADFKIEENMYATRRFYECDTCLQRILYFTAKQELDSYRWQIGNDPRLLGGRKIAMEFDTLIKYVDIQLIVRKNEPNIKCFPNDDGVDTVKKRIYFYKLWEWPVLGKYNGYYESNPSDTFTITVGYFPFSSTPAMKYYAVRGLKNDLYSYIIRGYERDIEDFTTYNFKIEQNRNLKGYIYKDAYFDKKSGKLYMEFLYSKGVDANGNDQIEIRKFLGKKIE